jgi:putative ATPase
VAADYLGVEKTYYEPVDRGLEAELRARLEDFKNRRRAAKQDEAGAAPA